MNLLNLLVICVTGLTLVAAVPAYSSNNIEHDNEVIEAPQQPESTWSRISREYGKCMNTPDAINCMAVKTVTAMQRAVRLPTIEVLPGVQLVRNSPYGVRDGKALSENEIEQSLPKTFSERTTKLVDMLLESTANFLQTHSIQIKLPEETTQELGRAIEEGRKKKKKKMMGGMMMLMGAKLMMLMPLLLIGTKFLAIKALLIAKIALLLALVGSAGSLGSLFSGKGGSSGGGHSSGSSGWSSSYAPSGSSGWSSGGGGPYARRSMSDDIPILSAASQSSSSSTVPQVVDAHDLAYSAQRSL